MPRSASTPAMRSGGGGVVGVPTAATAWRGARGFRDLRLIEAATASRCASRRRSACRSSPAPARARGCRRAAASAGATVQSRSPHATRCRREARGRRRRWTMAPTGGRRRRQCANETSPRSSGAAPAGGIKRAARHRIRASPRLAGGAQSSAAALTSMSPPTTHAALAPAAALTRFAGIVTSALRSATRPFPITMSTRGEPAAPTAGTTCTTSSPRSRGNASIRHATGICVPPATSMPRPCQTVPAVSAMRSSPG